MLHRYLIVALLVALAGCGRPEFGSSSKGGDVVDVNVDREPAAGDDNAQNNGGGVATNGNNGTSGDLGAPGEQPDRVDGGSEVLDSGAFAFAAYAAAATHGRNALVAPHGIARSLVIAYAAADTDTADAAATALAPYLGSNVYENFNTADLALDAEQSETFSMLAGVWLDEGVAVESSFAENLARYTGVEIRLLDIAAAPEDARNEINNWYSGQTGGRISEVVGPRTLDATSKFVVTDATWLSTSWGFGGFDPDRTTYATFAGTESNVQLPMMQTEVALPRFGDDTLQAVVLPLQGGFSVVAVLPADFEAFEASLGEDFLRRMMNEATTQDIVLSLPRLEVSDRVMLSDVADALGGGGLFADGATYDAFADGTTLSDSFQRTRVSFDESGIEVNAGSQGDPNMDGDGAPAPPQMVEMTFDRPFFFAIHSAATDQFVYLGRITQP